MWAALLLGKLLTFAAYWLFLAGKFLFPGRASSTGLPRRPSAPALAVLISLLSLSVALATLYFSQLRTTSRLSAFITDFMVTINDIEPHEWGVSFHTDASVSFELTNTGNSPSSLLKPFWIVPSSFGSFSCRNAERADWEDLSTQGFGGPGFRAFAFSIKPQVVMPSSIVTAEGSLDSRLPSDALEGQRSKADLGKTK